MALEFAEKLREKEREGEGGRKREQSNGFTNL